MQKVGLYVFCIIVVVAIIAVVILTAPKKTAKVVDASSPMLPGVPAGPEPEGELTNIYIQCDDVCTVSRGGEVIGQAPQYVPVILRPFRTRIGDKIEFVVQNKSGPGGLRATVIRNDAKWKTGSDKFNIPNGKWSKVANLPFANEANAAYAPHEKDVYDELKDAEWIWNENACTNCTVSFSLIIE